MDNEDFDLYGDLDEALIEPLQEEIQKKQAEELEKQKNDENFREKTEKEISELKTCNFQLKKNMSLLLATAKSEIERKDQQIKDLRREMDEIIFRKNKGSNKKTCDKWVQTDRVEFSDGNRNNSNRYRPKEQTDSDRHKRKLSPERRYSNDSRKTSHRDDNGSRNRNYEGTSRKLSHETNRSRSPEKHEKRSTKHDLRDDDLRKTLSKNKTDDKSSSSNNLGKDLPKKTDEKKNSSSDRDRRDKYKERSSSKTERDKHKSDPKHSKKDKVIKEKLASPKKVKSDLKSTESEATENIKQSIENIKVENIENKTDTPKTCEAPPETAKEQKEESNPISENSNNSVKNELQKTAVNKAAQKDHEVENMAVMSSNLNLSAESDTNEVVQNGPKVVTDQNDVKLKDEKTVKCDKLPENPPKVETPKKTVEPAPQKQKYVPIVVAKIFPDVKEMKKEVKSRIIPCPNQEDEQSKSVQKSTPIDETTSKVPLPITVIIEKSTAVDKAINELIITEKITDQKIEVMQEQSTDISEPKKEINSATESLNDSFESTKENSLNNSFEKRKHKKRKITTEVEADGTVVWTVTRKKRKTKEHS